MEDTGIVYIPEDNLTVSFEVTEDKPFNKCFECRSLRNGCSGPNLSAIGTIERVCEFLQLARIFFDHSYQDVADGTGLSLATVKRTFTGKVSDPSFFTISAIATFLLGDPGGKYPCAIPNTLSSAENDTRLNNALIELERAMNDNRDYKSALDNIHLSYNAEMQMIRDEAQKQAASLLEEIQRVREECERWRVESERWRAENDRKGKLIDNYITKLIIG